jgi:hypothetical protein
VNPRLRRILAVTAGLSLTGFVLGAVLGALLFGAASVVAAGVRPNLALPVLSAALGCGVLGLVLAPLAAWTLMRHVPLWRALGETALGTALGGIAGYLVPSASWPIPFPFTPPLVFALVGFVLAALRLRLAHRVKAASPPVVDVDV